MVNRVFQQPSKHSQYVHRLFRSQPVFLVVVRTEVYLKLKKHTPNGQKYCTVQKHTQTAQLKISGLQESLLARVATTSAIDYILQSLQNVAFQMVSKVASLNRSLQFFDKGFLLMTNSKQYLTYIFCTHVCNITNSKYYSPPVAGISSLHEITCCIYCQQLTNSE